MTRRAADIDDEIVQGLYDAAAGLVPWNVSLAGLFRVFNLRSMQLVFVDKRSGTLLGSEQPAELFDQGAVQGTLEHIREWGNVDPHVAAVASLPVGSIYDSERAGAARQFGATPFYRDYFSAYQNRGVLGAKVAEDNERAALIGLVRSNWHPRFSVEDAALFRRYCSHLSTALRIGRYVEKLRTDAIAGRALLEATDHPMLLVDAQLRIKATNAHGQRLLKEGHAFVDHQGILTCRTSDDAERLASVVTQLAKSTKTNRAAIRLAPMGGVPLLCTLWHLRPQQTMAAFGPEPSVLISIVTADPNAAVDPVFLEALFDLTPAESRVAIAMQAGTNLKSVADSRRVSLETIRSQVKSIYGKTGTRNRAQLANLLMRLIAP